MSVMTNFEISILFFTRYIWFNCKSNDKWYIQKWNFDERIQMKFINVCVNEIKVFLKEP